MKLTKRDERLLLLIDRYVRGEARPFELGDALPSEGFFDQRTGLRWYAVRSVTFEFLRVEAVPLGPPATDAEIRHRYGLGPKPADDEADKAKTAMTAARRRVGMADYAAGRLADLIRQVESVVHPDVTKLLHECRDYAGGRSEGRPA